MKTFLDWSAYENAGMGDAYADIPKTGGDFAKAVAVCINSRQCQTHTAKMVMCPSYRVTDNPNYSTGGRVRLLKAALNGELGDLPFTDTELAQSMELCVGCKGCKRECENNVDMAQIKIEYLAQRNAQIGISQRTRLFAALPYWLHRRPWLKTLLQWRNRSTKLAKLGERWLGITANRHLPEPTAQPFQPRPINQTPDNAADSREVVLFIDTFTHYFAPDIAEAALAVLEAADYQVIVAQPTAELSEPSRPLCCGRTFLAHGLLEQARTEAQRVITALHPYAAAGKPIIGLEPACLLALRDDYKALGLGEAAAQIAQQALLFEEFIAKENATKRLKLTLQPLPATFGQILVQGHCHEHAVGAMKSMRKVLRLIPELQFTLIDPNCCGMAGSFGLEAEHADTAEAMAEQALLPALRAHPKAKLLANGFSCRHQIAEYSAQHETLHLAQLLRAAL